MATEKYLLNELMVEDRDRFEDHLFRCQDCALDMSAAVSLLEHTKVALSRTVLMVCSQGHVADLPRRVRWLWPAIATVAIVILLGVVGYQNTIQYSILRSALAVAESPQLLPSAVLVNSRDAAIPAVRVQPAAQFLLLIDVPVETNFVSYAAELQSSDGRVEWTLPISADAAHDTIGVRVPGVENSGEYLLVLRGITTKGEKGLAVRHYPFRVDYSKP